VLQKEKNGKYRVLTILLLFLPGILLAQADQCRNKIRGIINSATDHKGLRNVSVQIPELKIQVYSDSNGHFEICNLATGNYTLIFRSIGFDSLSVNANTEKKKKLILHLREKDHWLNAIDVKGQRRHFESEVVEAETIHKVDLERNRGISLGELVRKIPGVSSIQTGPTLFKPVIQGMTGQRIAIVQNGVKLEGQQWGFDHAPETDAGQADQITVVKGAQAVRFGADAIGGSILLEPGEINTTGKLVGNWNSGFATNGKGIFKSVSIEKTQGKKHVFSWRIRSGFKKSGSFNTPKYVLGNTAIEEWSAQAIVRHQFANSWKNELIYSTYFNKPGIFSGSHISSPEGIRQAFKRPDSSYNYSFSYNIARPYQKIKHQVLKAKSEYQWNQKHQSQIIISYQKDKRSEYDIIRASSSNCPDCPQLYFELESKQAEINHTIKKEGLEVKMGMVGTYQSNVVERKILIPNFRMQQSSSFGVITIYNKKWAYEVGARVEYRKQQIFRYIGNDLQSPVRLFLNYMINAGARYQISDHWHAKINLQSSKRAPNVSELYSNGVHQGSASFEKGNENMVPEQILNAAFSVHYQSEKWSFLLNAFETWSPDFIYLSPVRDSIITNIRGPFPFFQYRQSKVNLRGLDARLEWQFHKKWNISAKGAMIRSWNISDQQYLIYQPADQLDLRIEYETHWGSSGYSLQINAGPVLVSKQYRVPEKQDFTESPSSYMLWNARVALRKNVGKFRFDASVEGQNLANLAYRDYMNRFRYYAYDLGRNILIRLNIPLIF